MYSGLAELLLFYLKTTEDFSFFYMVLFIFVCFSDIGYGTYYFTRQDIQDLHSLQGHRVCN
ncbi:MAG: hypothetical protein ACI3ZS_01730 [Candidatus Cryptobacteroides sp.]